MSAAMSLDQAEIAERSFIHRVYNWMAGGLAVTGVVAFYMASNPALIVSLMRNPILFWGLLIAELGLVFALAGWVRRMSSSTAGLVFLGYAALNGLTLSALFLVYTSSSIDTAFFVTAGTFAVMSLYGYTTKTDLTSLGNICFMGLLGIIMASLVNLFLRSPAVYWLTTYLGVAIFTGLVAYDTQKIKGLCNAAATDAEEESKEAISGALALYLDFINLFLDLLRILGKRRED